MKKKPYKSKTINSAIVIAIMVLLSIIGVGEKEISKTYDTIANQTGNKVENSINIIKLLGVVGVVYGRYKVKEKDDED